MSPVSFLKLVFVAFSLAVLVTTSWLVISRTGLLNGFRPTSCTHCTPSDGDVPEVKVVSSGIAETYQKQELAKKLDKCKENSRVLRERLDWEMQRADSKNFEEDEVTQKHQDFSKIKIVVNSKDTIKGFRNDQDAYIPFSFIKKHFEIQGGYRTDKKDILDWKHAVIQPWTVPKRYQPNGQYVGLINAIVENRKRVKCIDGIFQVPVTSQWNKNGYFYATQIAQYGLAHYNKYLQTDSEKNDELFNHEENYENWLKLNNVETVYDNERKRKVIHFEGKSEKTLSGPLDHHIVSFDIKWTPRSKAVIKVNAKTGESILINYVQNDDFISCKYPNIFVGVGAFADWRKITRNIRVDFNKGLQCVKSQDVQKPNLSFFAVESISFHGSGYVGSLTLSASAHVEMFMNAANWLVKFQDEDGGWPVNCTRKILPQAVSPPGWRSAMGSGQAISLLCRVFSFTKNAKYLRAAEKALGLFNKSVDDDGFVSTVMGSFKMYEEYPTNPPLHILNGFIFSLVGLFDLSETLPSKRTARRLLKQGIKTLIHILPLYDSGFGTFYDLRHIVIPGEEPKRARWDYHAVHLGQLTLLKIIVKDPSIDKILNRWTKYVQGIPARHN